MHHNFNSEWRFGSADWADEQSIRAAGLFENLGVQLGFWRSRTLRYNGDAPILLCGGSGSGKGACVLIYVLCRSPGEPMLTLDLRGELYSISQPAHTRNREFAYSWNPYRVGHSPQLACNPLDILRPDSEYVHADCKFTAENLVVSSGGGSARYFETRARSWISDFLVSLTFRHGGVDFPRLYRLVRSIEADPSAWAEHAEYMLSSPFESVRGTAAEVLAKQADSPREFGSIMGEILGSLTCLDNPVLLRSLENPDFSLEELCRDDPVRKIFLITPAEHIQQTSPVLRTFFTTAMLYKSRKPQSKRITFLIDEAAQLQNFPALRQAQTYGRGSGIRNFTVWQDLGQIVEHHGAPALRSFVGSSAVVVMFGIRDYQSAEEVSNRLGYETLQYDDERVQMDARRQERRAYERMFYDDDFLGAAFDAQHFGETAQLRVKQSRRLLTADEILTMREDRMFVFMAGRNLKPIFAEKYPYFTRPEMAGWYGVNPYHPPIDSLVIPTKQGSRRVRMITTPVPTALAHLPQHRDGYVSFPEGYRPF